MCGRRRCMYATRACGSGRVCALVYLVFGSSLVLGCFVHDCICVGMYDPCVKGPCWLFDISAIFVVAHGACDASCEQALTLHGLSQFAPVLHCVHTPRAAGSCDYCEEAALSRRLASSGALEPLVHPSAGQRAYA